MPQHSSTQLTTHLPTPAHIRANIYWPAVQFESANRFQNWIDQLNTIKEARCDTRTTNDSSVLSRVTQLVRG